MRAHAAPLAVACLVVALGASGTARQPAVRASNIATLSVPGRANQTPWVASDGDVVAVAWGATGPGGADVYVAVSRDAGSTFADPVRVNPREGEARLGGELPPRVALVPGGTRGREAVAVLWTSRGDTTAIRIARSTDGGRTFGDPPAVSGPAAAGDRGWPSLAVDGSGPHAFWLDHRGHAPGSHAASTHRTAASYDGVAIAQRSSLYYRPAVGGAPAKREIVKGVCYCCKTAAAAGPGGRLYVAWRHVFPDNIRDIAFTRSVDGGRTFAAPARVSADGWQIAGCPDDGPAMAVDTAGRVHVVWPTVVGGETPRGALFHAVSADGATFSPRHEISTLGGPRPSHPQIAIAGSGRVVVAWDEVIDGRRVVAARVLGEPPEAPAIPLSGGEAGMYPVLAARRGGVLAVWSTGGEASVIRVAHMAVP